MALEPNRDQIEIFVDCVFRHAQSGFVSLRAFAEGSNNVFRKTSIRIIRGNLKFLCDAVVDDARRAAQFPKPIIFCRRWQHSATKRPQPSRMSPRGSASPLNATNARTTRARSLRIFSARRLRSSAAAACGLMAMAALRTNYTCIGAWHSRQLVIVVGAEVQARDGVGGGLCAPGSRSRDRACIGSRDSRRCSVTSPSGSTK